MFEAANDPVYDPDLFKESLPVARAVSIPPFYVFQHGIDGNQFGYVTKYGYCNVGFNSYSDAAEAAEEYTKRVER